MREPSRQENSRASGPKHTGQIGGPRSEMEKQGWGRASEFWVCQSLRLRR